MPETSDQMGISEYVAVFRRRRRTIFSVGVPIVLIALAVAFALPRVYQSSSLIEIQTSNSSALRGESGGNQEYVDKYVRSVAAQVLSYDNRKKWVEAIQPYPDLQGDVGAAAAQINEDVEVDIVTTRILDPGSGNEREVISGFSVSAFNADPTKAYAIASEATKQFVIASRAMGSEGVSRTSDFLASEVERYRSLIAETEEKLALFKAKNFGNMPELTDVNLQLMDRNEAEVANMQLQMQTLRRERSALVLQLQQTRQVVTDDSQLAELEQELRSKVNLYDPNHPDIIALRRQIDVLKAGADAGDANSLPAQLQAKRSILTQTQQRYSADHPDIKRLQREIDTLQARIASGETVDTTTPARRNPIFVQLQTRINGIDADLAALSARTAELQSRSREFERRLQATPEVEREMQDLSRNLTLAREKYGELQKQQMQADVSKAAITGGAADEFRVVTAPALPTSPAKPNRLILLAIGAFFAVVLGLSSAVVAEVIDPTVRGARDVIKLLNITPLATVPRIQNSLSSRQRSLFALAFSASCVVGTAALYAAIAFWT